MKLAKYITIALIIGTCFLKGMEEGAAEERSESTNTSVLIENLKDAVEKYDTKRIKELILAGAEPNLPVNNPLIAAFYHNDFDLVQFLLHHRASLDMWTPNPAWPTVVWYLMNPSKPVSSEIKNYVIQWKNRSEKMGSSEHKVPEKEGRSGGT